jgi:hypothetical protein
LRSNKINCHNAVSSLTGKGNSIQKFKKKSPRWQTDYYKELLFVEYNLKQGFPTWGTRPPRGTGGVDKGDASFFWIDRKNRFFECLYRHFFEIFADLNINLANYRRTQLAKLKFFLTYSPSASKGHLTRVTYAWGDAGFIIFNLGGQWREKVGNPCPRLIRFFHPSAHSIVISKLWGSI